MLRKAIIPLSLLAAILICLCGSGFGQEGWLEQPPEPPPPERMEQVRKDIENMRIWKMTQYLELSTEQSTKFFPLFNDFQRKREKLEGERGEMMRQLGELVDSESVSESKIKKLMSDLAKNQQKMFELPQEFRREAGEVLTTRQQAKLVLFEEWFREEIRRMVDDIRKRHKFREGFPQPWNPR
jgi:Spy/CpxP family protein refolding chaperone